MHVCITYFYIVPLCSYIAVLRKTGLLLFYQNIDVIVDVVLATCSRQYVAVAGRKGTLFLSLFDHFFRLCTVITWTIGNVGGCKLTSNNFNLSTKGLPGLGLKCQSICAGHLI